MSCIFLNYANEEFVYMLWNYNNVNVYRSQDVDFVEDHTIDDFGESIRQKVGERIKPMVVVPHEHHIDGDENIPH